MVFVKRDLISRQDVTVYWQKFNIIYNIIQILKKSSNGNPSRWRKRSMDWMISANELFCNKIGTEKFGRIDYEVTAWDDIMAPGVQDGADVSASGWSVDGQEEIHRPRTREHGRTQTPAVHQQTVLSPFLTKYLKKTGKTILQRIFLKWNTSSLDGWKWNLTPYKIEKGRKDRICHIKNNAN